MIKYQNYIFSSPLSRGQSVQCCVNLYSKGVTWLLVYRTEKYQKLKLEIEKQSKKLEKKKEAHGDVTNLDRSKKRKLEQDEEKLKNTNRDLTMVKMKSMFIIGIWILLRSGHIKFFTFLHFIAQPKPNRTPHHRPKY